MSIHHAKTHWSRDSVDFHYDTYPRNHAIALGVDTTLEVSAAAEYKGDRTRTNPEELLVAALSSCHMLTFLAICAKKSLVVDRYDDKAEGVLEKGEDGRLWITHVTLRPRVVFTKDTTVDSTTMAKLHESAHRGCFIASSVKTKVTVVPESADA